MIIFDTTKSGASGHKSGLMRVNARLREALGDRARAVSWRSGGSLGASTDWFFTTELFSEAERPGFSDFVRRKPCRLAALFHDAIPLKFPHITWPQSVARHPEYMKLLSEFDRVFVLSAETGRELTQFWRWQGIGSPPPVEALSPGADFNGASRVVERTEPARPGLLCVGIVEPRKNQAFLAEVCAELWEEGLEFGLDVVGRTNPHFGAPILARLREIGRRHRFLRYREAVDDAELARLYASASAGVFPTIAEGCGLPLIEALWMGIPCVSSDLPALRENAAGGGCVSVPVNDRQAWKAAIRAIVSDGEHRARLTREARTRELATWSQTAQRLCSALSTIS